VIDPGYLHLWINHFPIVLGIVGTLAALLALGMRRRAVWLFAVACLTLAGLFAQPVVMTGEVARDAMRDAWYLSRDAVEAHEAAGEWARWALLLAGAGSAFAWFSLLRTPRTTAQQRDGRTGDFPRWLQALVVVSALLAVATSLRAAWLGGRLVHANETLAFPPGAPQPGAAQPAPEPTAPDTTVPTAPPGPAPDSPLVTTPVDSGARQRRP
jgi:hypothetical protein